LRKRFSIAFFRAFSELFPDETVENWAFLGDGFTPFADWRRAAGPKRELCFLIEASDPERFLVRVKDILGSRYRVAGLGKAMRAYSFWVGWCETPIFLVSFLVPFSDPWREKLFERIFYGDKEKFHYCKLFNHRVRLLLDEDFAVLSVALGRQVRRPLDGFYALVLGSNDQTVVERIEELAGILKILEKLKTLEKKASLFNLAKERMESYKDRGINRFFYFWDYEERWLRSVEAEEARMLKRMKSSLLFKDD